MKRKRVVWLLLAAGLLAAAGGVGWWMNLPGPLKGVYDSVAFGMTEREVEALVPPLVHAEEHAPLIVAIDWEGRIGGNHHRAHFPGEDIDDHPVLRDAVLFHNRDDLFMDDLVPGVITPGVVAYKDRAGQLVATERTWATRTEALDLLFDPAGRVVEKKCMQYRSDPPFWATVKESAADWVSKWWPF
jgi:hypothetical protein